MICRQCRRSLTSRLTSSLSPSPTVASSISRRCISFVPQRQLQIQFHNNTRTQTQSIQSRFYSSEAASEALPKDDAAGANANAAAAAGPSSETAAAQKPKVVSSVVAGTVLRGLNYEKNKTDPVAKEDHEYPDWLWSLLEKSEAKAKAADVDVASLNKKQRKKHEKKMAALAAMQPRTIPLHEQSIDITPAPYNNPNINANADVTAGDESNPAIASVNARSDITKSARLARRKAIKEDNYLRGL